MMKELDVREFIDSRKLSKIQILVIVFGLLGAFLDGLDVVIIGFIAPALKADWALSNNDLAPIMSAALVGLAMGAMIVGPLSDRIGRKKILCFCLIGFGSLTLMTSASNTIMEITILRFITGIFMGGILPQIVTLVTDYCSLKLNGRLVTLMIAGYAVGCAFAGFLSAWIIPHYGWRAVLHVVGVMPIILGLVAFKFVPESFGFMVLRDYPEAMIKKIAGKIDASLNLDKVKFTLPKKDQRELKNPVRVIFNHHYRYDTFSLWWCYAVGVYVLYLLSSWLPILISSNGFTHSQASIITAFLQLGGPIGCILCGILMDKVNRFYGLVIAYVCLIMALLSAVIFEPSYITYAVICMFIGMWTHGSNAGLNSLSSSIYPVEARATGNSFMHGIARAGSVIGIFAGAMMLNMGFSPKGIFISLIYPLVTVMILILIMKYRHGRKLALQHQQQVAAELSTEKTV